MNNRLFQCIMLIVVSGISSFALAYDGWSGTGQIRSIRAYSGDYVLVVVDDAANPGNCSETSYIKLKQEDGNEAQKRQYSALLSAYMAGKNVSLALTGCSGGGTSGYPLIEQVWLK